MCAAQSAIADDIISSEPNHPQNLRSLTGDSLREWSEIRNSTNKWLIIIILNEISYNERRRYGHSRATRVRLSSGLPATETFWSVESQMNAAVLRIAQTIIFIYRSRIWFLWLIAEVKRMDNICLTFSLSLCVMVMIWVKLFAVRLRFKDRISNLVQWKIRHSFKPNLFIYSSSIN